MNHNQYPEQWGGARVGRSVVSVNVTFFSAEQGARTEPRREDEDSSGTAAAQAAGESSAATKEKPVDGSVNTGIRRRCVYVNSGDY